MVDILLSTFNGEKYLKELIDSLLEQDYKEMRILIRDDGSTDNTLEIIENYKKIHRNIILIKDNLGNIGSTKSFLTLLNYSDSEYVAFCDQDDIWEKDKISTCLNELSNKSKPTLVYSNLELIDENNKCIHPSYYKYMRRNPRDNDIESILKYRGLIPGCSMVFNKQLKDRFKYNDIDRIDFHDLYLTYIAASFGELDYIDRPLIKYRQTKDNQLGANRKGVIQTILYSMFIDREFIKKIININKRTYESIDEFLSTYKNKLNNEEIKVFNIILQQRRTNAYLILDNIIRVPNKQ